MMVIGSAASVHKGFRVHLIIMRLPLYCVDIDIRQKWSQESVIRLPRLISWFFLFRSVLSISCAPPMREHS